ncbi:threonine aldolase family protein [Heyndrickxia acidiproducens]|uniref:threonine aldolase family protein n=1 Tax=Heyndrickxia acidiproducens TaxID=1121084 RepID=UPI00036FD7EC|nr:GntG family PLP-dependent aldolase [Heyndrickxia acidiproducens]
MIDLRSDTLTIPSEEMREVMRFAEVGDDCYSEDGSVNRLEAYCKELFGAEDALFVSSGTMANQLAVKTQVEEANEVITEANYHISFYESGQTASLSRVVLNTVRTVDGVLRVDDIEKAIKSKPRGFMYAQPQLVTIENTINYYQGKIFPLEEIKKIRSFTSTRNISLHLDGARLFNAHIATGIPLKAYAKEVDTLSVCFAKGLGAPFGSMLMGKRSIITSALKYRKHFGGGLHQVGIYAAAALYALNNNLGGIHEDHRLTKKLAALLSEISEFGICPKRIETNMIFFDVGNIGVSSYEFIESCKKKGLLLFPWLPGIVRVVMHRNISEEQVEQAARIIKDVYASFKRSCLYV